MQLTKLQTRRISTNKLFLRQTKSTKLNIHPIWRILAILLPEGKFTELCELAAKYDILISAK